MIDFVQANRHLLEGRPIAYHHGDFHTGNFLLGPDGKLKILDFDRYDIGDPGRIQPFDFHGRFVSSLCAWSGRCLF